MATYVNDLRLKEISTGDESGTWGTSTNTNLELIGEAFSFGTEAITTNADTHTTTIADGSTDPGRSLFLKYTGALDSDCTVTIGPNTVSKLWFIENATTDSGSSGPYNIIIKQGSGATVTVPNGNVKAIYSDGAGSGGKMVDAFTALHVKGLVSEVDDNGSALTVISTDADASVGPLMVFRRESSSPADDDLLGRINFNGFNDASEGVTYGRIQTTIRDASNGTEDGELTLSTIVAGSNRSRAKFGLTETVFNEASEDLDFRIESDSNTSRFFLDAENDRIVMGHTAGISVSGTNGAFQLIGDTSNTRCMSITNFSNDANSSTFRFGKSRGSSIGSNAIVQSGDNLGHIIFAGDDGTNLGSKAADILGEVDGTPGSDDMPGRLVFRTTADGADSTTERMRITSGGRVGIGTTSPSSTLHISSSTPKITLTDSDTDRTSEVFAASDNLVLAADTGNAGDDSHIRFEIDTQEHMRIDSSGNVGIGTSSPTAVSGTTVLEITGTSGNAGAEVIIGSSDTSATANDLFGGLAFKSIDSNGTPPHYSGIKARAADTFGGASLEFYVGRSNYESDDPRVVIEGPQSVSGEAMRIDSSGNVGIGETNPQYNLHIKGSGDTGIQLTKDGVVAGRVSAVTTGLSFGVDGANGTTERMRIDSSGNLLQGITTIPTGVQSSRQLISSNSTGAEIIAYREDNAIAVNDFCGAFLIGHDDNSGTEDHFIGMWGEASSANGNMNLKFAAGRDTYETGGSHMMISSAGDLLVGTTASQGLVTIRPEGGGASSVGYSVRPNADICTAVNFRNTAGTQIGHISITASTTTYNTSSDQRLKENIEDADDAGSKVDAIQVRKFDWIADGSHQDYGMIAQELQTVAPEAVSGDADSEDMMGVDYSKLVPMLIKEIQSLRARVAQLENN